MARDFGPVRIWQLKSRVTSASVNPASSGRCRCSHSRSCHCATAAVIRIESNDLGQPLVEIPVTVAMLERLVPLAAGGAAATPALLVLEQNYPNPFNPKTTLPVVVNAPGSMRLEVLDVRGRVLRTLHDGALDAGRHDFLWDGRDEAGLEQSGGVYLYRLSGELGEASGKMLLLK